MNLAEGGSFSTRTSKIKRRMLQSLTLLTQLFSSLFSHALTYVDDFGHSLASVTIREKGYKVIGFVFFFTRSDGMNSRATGRLGAHSLNLNDERLTALF